MLQGLDVVWAPNTLPDPPVADASQIVSLAEANVHHGENDKAIKALSDHFGPITPSGINRSTRESAQSGITMPFLPHACYRPYNFLRIS